MKKVEITLYTIDELKEINEKAFNKIIDDERQYIIDSRFNFASMDCVERLKEKYNLDIDEKDIYYSISYCQGDGVCFTANKILSYFNIVNKNNLNAFEKWIIDNLNDDELSLLLDYLNCNYNLSIIKDSHHYCHYYTCIIDYEIFYSSDDPKYLDRVNNFILSLCKKLFSEVFIVICKDIEKYLYTYYEVDEEECIDNIKCNDYMYTSTGEIY